MQWLDAIFNLIFWQAGKALPELNMFKNIVQVLGEEENVWGSCLEQTG
jgi:hypothetical protein